MFLFWLALLIFIGVCEEVKDSYDAYKFHQTPEYHKMLTRFDHHNK